MAKRTITNMVLETLDNARDGNNVLPWRYCSTLPKNGGRDGEYSALNIILLWRSAMRHDYRSQEWFTREQAADAGGTIPDDAQPTRAYKFYFAEFPNLDKVELTWSEYNELSEAEKEKVPHWEKPTWTLYNLYNRDQCLGLPTAQNDDQETTPFPGVDILAEYTGIEIRKGIGLDYDYARDVLEVRPRRWFDTIEQFIGQTLEGLVKSTQHNSRVGWELSRRKFGRHTSALSRLVIELATSILAAKFGLHYEPRNSGYLPDWIRSLDQKPSAIFEVCWKVDSILDYFQELPNYDSAA